MKADAHKLFSKYSDGTISPEDFEALDELLSKSEDLRKEFLEYMKVCTVLEHEAPKQANLKAKQADASPQAQSKQPQTTRFSRWSIAVAACLALALSAWFLNSEPNAPAAIVTARVLDQEQLNGRKFTIGDQIALNELQLEKGWLRLELPKGVLFDIYGPAKGQFETPQRFRLDSGRLNVDVGPLGKGFTVITGSADIVDLGTQFGVEVEEDANAKVAVFSGEVEVHSKSKTPYPRLLSEGEGIQVASSGAASRLMSMHIADQGEAGYPKQTFSSNINISDIFTSDESLRYYGILGGGMREGVHAYTTLRSVRWRSEAGKEFPAALLGADLIQTFHKDRTQKELNISLDVKEPSTVYLMFDARYSLPAWLTDTFTDTGIAIRSGPWRPVLIVSDLLPDTEGYFYVPYKVWSKKLFPGETLSLGESRDNSSPENHRAMYGIAVKKNAQQIAQAGPTNQK